MSRKLSIAAGLVLVAGAMMNVAFAQTPGVSQPQIVTTTKFAKTPPLRDTRWDLSPLMRRVVGKHHYSKATIERLRQSLIHDGYIKLPQPMSAASALRTASGGAPYPARDSAVQSMLPQSTSGFSSPLASFEGLDIGTSTIVPQDNIAIGNKYVIQTTGVDSFSVYDKQGNLVLGPTHISYLWANTGDLDCSHEQTGGSVVLYDQLAHRWILAQTALLVPPGGGQTTGGAYCMAISTTDDPTGSYYLYDYTMSAHDTYISIQMPKLSVWPDGYYYSSNLSQTINGAHVGSQFAAFDRDAMLNGDPNARVMIFTTTESNSALYNLAANPRPASLDGYTLPPAGSPGYFLNYTSPNTTGSDSGYALELWQLHVDWQTPSNSQLTGPTDIAVDPFNDFICGPEKNNTIGGYPVCLPQPGTGVGLDAVSDRLMYRLAYRNFGDHQALVVNQTVGLGDNGGPPSGIRWYELDAPSASTAASAWTLAQQSTFAPDDGKSRWSGSIAMDHSGDMALGYSVSNPTTTWPSVWYTGRLAGDPAGEMTQGGRCAPEWYRLLFRCCLWLLASIHFNGRGPVR